MWKCKYCQTDNEIDSEKCSHCGSPRELGGEEITTVVTKVNTVKTITTETTNKEIKEIIEKPKDPPSAKPKSKNKLLIGIFLVSILIIVSAVVYAEQYKPVAVLTPTLTPMPTATPISTPSPTSTPIATLNPTQFPTPSPTPTPMPTQTPDTAIPTPTSTASPIPITQADVTDGFTIYPAANTSYGSSFNIIGWMYNIGSLSAYNITVNVIMYSGNIVAANITLSILPNANETYVNIPYSMQGNSSTYIDTGVYLNEFITQTITSYVVTPMWTDSP